MINNFELVVVTFDSEICMSVIVPLKYSVINSLRSTLCDITFIIEIKKAIYSNLGKR